MTTQIQSLGVLHGISLVGRTLGRYRWKASIALTLTNIGIVLEAVALVSLVPFFELLTGGSANSLSQGGLFGAVHSLFTIAGIEYTIGNLLAIIATLFMLKSLVTIGGEIGRSSVYTDFERDIRDDLAVGLLGTRWAYVRDQRAGNILNLITQQASRAGSAISQGMKLLSEVGTVAIYSAFAMFISPIGTLLLVAILGVMGFLIRYVFRSLTMYGKYSLEHNNRLMQRLNEMILGFKVVKAEAVENIVGTRIKVETGSIKHMAMRGNVIRAIFASTLEPGIIIALGSVLLLRAIGITTLGEAGVIGLLLLRAVQRVYGAAVSVTGVADALPSLEAVTIGKTQIGSSPEPDGHRSASTFESVRLDNVSFEYQSGLPVLSKVTLDVRRGEFIGIVGSSGSGKTTLVDILLGLIEPSSGHIFVNEIPLSQIRKEEWRRRVGYVPQEIVLFNESVLDNVSMGRTQVSNDDAIRAIDISQATKLVESLPNGLTTLVGDRGLKLSGGERQRLALARAIAIKPELLILDEATSSLDTVAELEFQKAIHAMRSKFTIIAVAHRLSTVLDADRIAVFESGRLVELGQPNQLLNTDGGAFKRLFEAQSDRSSSNRASAK